MPDVKLDQQWEDRGMRRKFEVCGMRSFFVHGKRRRRVWLVERGGMEVKIAYYKLLRDYRLIKEA